MVHLTFSETKSPVWLHDYSYGEKYLSNVPSEIRAITGSYVAKITEKMIDAKDQNRVWQSYIQHRQVNYQPIPYSRYILYCAMKHAAKIDFDGCVKGHPVTGG